MSYCAYQVNGNGTVTFIDRRHPVKCVHAEKIEYLRVGSAGHHLRQRALITNRSHRGIFSAKRLAYDELIYRGLMRGDRA